MPPAALPDYIAVLSPCAVVLGMGHADLLPDAAPGDTQAVPADWSVRYYRDMLAQLAAQGVRKRVLRLDDSPPDASRTASDCGRSYVTPEAYAQFVTTALTIHAGQYEAVILGNEPDSPGAEVAPRCVAAVLKAGADAARAVSQQTNTKFDLYTGPLAGADVVDGPSGPAYLTELLQELRALGSGPEQFDGFGLSLYPLSTDPDSCPDVRWSFTCSIAAARAALPGISWVVEELGWPTGGGHASSVSEDEQARALTAAGERARQLVVPLVVVYEVRDPAPGSQRYENALRNGAKEVHYGLFGEGGRPKPAAGVLRQLAADGLH